MPPMNDPVIDALTVVEPPGQLGSSQIAKYAPLLPASGLLMPLTVSGLKNACDDGTLDPPSVGAVLEIVPPENVAAMITRNTEFPAVTGLVNVTGRALASCDWTTEIVILATPAAQRDYSVNSISAANDVAVPDDDSVMYTAKPVEAGMLISKPGVNHSPQFAPAVNGMSWDQ